MGWILLIVFAAAVGVSFTAPARNTDRPAGIFCILLLVTAAGLYSAKVGMDLIVSVTARALDTAVSSNLADDVSKQTLSSAPLIPGLAGSIVRAVLWVPLTVCTLVQVVRGRFKKDFDMAEAAAHRLKLGYASAALMAVTFIASVVLLFAHAEELIGIGILIGWLVVVLLIFSLICPLFLLLVLAVAGVGIIAVVKLLSLPIMLYFVSSAAYLLSVVCAVGICVSAMKLTRIKKPWYILLILLSLLPAANCAVYHIIPALMKKYPLSNGMI